MHGTHAALALAVVLAGSVAGCLGAWEDDPSGTEDPGTAPSSPTPERPAELGSRRGFAVNASDGTTLRGDVYLPAGDGPFATVLVLSPWWNTYAAWGHAENQATEVDGRETLVEPWQPLMDAGFAVAMVNPRGTGESDGCFQMGGPVDGRDAHQVIQALANASWSNGRVGMYGYSFAAWYQYVALIEDPPALEAIVPVSGVVDAWTLATRNGAPVAGVGPAMAPLLTALTAGGRPGTGGGFLPDTALGHFACPNYPAGAVESGLLAWSGDRTEWWVERDYRDEIEDAGVPTLVTNGLATSEGHILQVEGLWERLPEGDRRMILGQWGHGYPHVEGERSQFPAEVVAWLDRHLRGGDETVETDAVEYQDDAGDWHAADAWPPDGDTARLHLSGDRLVADPSEVARSSQTFQSADHDPCLSRCRTGQEALVEADAPTPCRDTQALYVSAPLEERVVLAGNVHVNATLSSTQPDGNLAAFLYHTPGDGSCPDPEAEEVRRALTDLRHPTYRADGSRFPVGEPTRVSVRSVPLASAIPAGHRLVLAIGGGSADLFPDAREPVLTVSTGPDRVGHVDLPVVEGDLAVAGPSAGVAR